MTTKKRGQTKNQANEVKIPPTIPIANRAKRAKFNGLGMFTKNAKSFGFGF